MIRIYAKYPEKSTLVFVEKKLDKDSIFEGHDLSEAQKNIVKNIS